MTNSYCKKKTTKKSFQKRFVKGTKVFLKKKKTKSNNMLVSEIEIFLKKEKKRSVNIVANDIKIFNMMSIESVFLECKKQRLAEYKIFLFLVYGV